MADEVNLLGIEVLGGNMVLMRRRETIWSMHIKTFGESIWPMK